MTSYFTTRSRIVWNNNILREQGELKYEEIVISSDFSAIVPSQKMNELLCSSDESESSCRRSGAFGAPLCSPFSLAFAALLWLWHFCTTDVTADAVARQEGNQHSGRKH